MSTPILDDPQDLDNHPVPKISSRYWLAAGMGMAILLLANNLWEVSVYHPASWYSFRIGRFIINTGTVVYVAVFTLGMIWLTEALLRVKPVPTRFVLLKNAFFSSIFAIFAFLSIEIFASYNFENVDVLSIFINTGYCLLVALGWFSLRRKKG